MQQNQITNDNILQLIQNILQSSQTDTIKVSEQALNDIKLQYPNEFIQIYLNILQSSQSIGIRQFCGVGLRKHLSQYSEKSYTNIWSLLNENTQNLIKNSLFTHLIKEPEKKVRDLVCDAIGEIASSVLSNNNDNDSNINEDQQIQIQCQWPEFINTLFQLYALGTPQAIESTLRILSILFQNSQEIFKNHKYNIQTIFTNSFQYESFDVKLQAIKSLAAWISVLNPQECKTYEGLIPKLLENIKQLIQVNSYQGSEALSALCEIAEAEPKFFKKNFQQLFITLQQIVQLKDLEDAGLKKLAIEIIILLSERIPNILKNKQDMLRELLEMILLRMLDVEMEVTEEWCKPPQDLDTDSDFANVKFGMHAIDRLIHALNYQVVLPILSQLVQQLLQQNSDSRYQHAALMALSQVGEYVENVEYIQPIIEIVTPYILNEHPKLRYAACHCIGQIADDMKPNFQIQYNTKCVPLLIQIMSDPIPRVQSHACAALTNIFEGSPQDNVLPYMNEALERAFNLIQSGISIVKENAMSCISAISESAKELYIPYYDISMPILYSILTSHNNKEYKQLRGQTIECITLMSQSVGKEYFKKYSKEVIQVLIDIQTSNIEDNDPLKSYLLTGWQRLCVIMDKDILVYMQYIVPSLFEMASSIFRQSCKEEEDENTLTRAQLSEKKLQENVNTTATEEAEIAINMLNVFIDQLGGDYSEYVQPTVDLVIPMINFSTNDNIRKCVSKCLPKLIKCILDSQCKTDKNITAIHLAQVFNNVLWNAISTEFEPSVIILQLESIKNNLKIVGRFMNSQQVLEFGNQILIVLNESQNRKSENDLFKQTDDIEDNELLITETNNQKEYQLQEIIADVIGVLFLTHQELTLPFATYIYKHILIQAFQSDHSQPQLIRFSLYIASDIIEYLGIELIPSIWPSLQQALIKYSLHIQAEVRQPAIYALGILAEKNPEIFESIANNTIETLITALQIPIHNQESAIQYGNTKDNVVAVFGKIIKVFGNKLDLQRIIPLWLSNLPLKYDRAEAIKQHLLLTDICLNRLELIVGNNGEFMVQLLIIFGELITTKTTNQTIRNNIQTLLQSLISNSNTKNLIYNAVAQLTDNQRVRLDKYI